MLRSGAFSKRFLVGVLGLGLASAVAACSPNESAQTPTTEPDSTVSEAPTEEVPATGESPLAPSTEEQAAGDENLSEVVEGNDSFNTFEQAVAAAGLEETLAEPGPYTIFAPTDEAFAALPPETLDQLLKPENQEQLRQILSYHVVSGSLTSPSITSGELTTAAGEPITIEANAGQVTVDGAQVVEPDLLAQNGVIHGIDQVLLPPGLQVQ